MLSTLWWQISLLRSAGGAVWRSLFQKQPGESDELAVVLAMVGRYRKGRRRQTLTGNPVLWSLRLHLCRLAEADTVTDSNKNRAAGAPLITTGCRGFTPPQPPHNTASDEDKRGRLLLECSGNTLSNPRGMTSCPSPFQLAFLGACDIYFLTSGWHLIKAKLSQPVPLKLSGLIHVNHYYKWHHVIGMCFRRTWRHPHCLLVCPKQVVSFIWHANPVS